MPEKTPYFIMACLVYSEQEGTYRQTGGRFEEKKLWYNVIGLVKKNLTAIFAFPQKLLSLWLKYSNFISFNLLFLPD